MKKLVYLEGCECAPATDKDIAQFKSDMALPSLSSGFVEYCKTDNGGVPEACNEYFKPSLTHAAYWKFCRQRVINPSGEIDINRLLGIGERERFSIRHWTENANRVWKLPVGFFVIAYDGIGSKIVSKLRAEDDAVCFWEPHVEPHFFRIADTVTEFYSNLTSSQDI